MRKTKIGIYPAVSLARDSKIWDALRALVPVEFVGLIDGDDCKQLRGAVFVSDNADLISSCSHLVPKLFQFVTSPGEHSFERSSRTVTFTDSLILDRRIRGRSLTQNGTIGFRELAIEDGEEVLACCEIGPIWSRRRTGRAELDITAAPFPSLTNKECAYDYLNGRRFIHLLPLLHFLREVVGHHARPTRACFMFDDPNLHWKTYGFVEYRRIVEAAQTNGFHVAFATVPLDSWYVNRQTAEIFRRHPRQISLLIHGNDHLHCEFGANGRRDRTTRRIAQALHRIQRLEARSRVHIARVMAPPHGACSLGMLQAMLALGFEGATISVGSLRRWINGVTWPSQFGLDLAEMVQGFPVIPRFRLSDSCANDIVIGAFLEQPIIAVGHHATLRDGTCLLVRLAKLIGTLGPVQWMRPIEIFETNIHMEVKGSRVLLKPYSRNFIVTIPDGVTEMMVENNVASRIDEQCHYKLTRLTAESASALELNDGRVCPVSPGETLRVTSIPRLTHDYRNYRPLAMSPWAISRRVFCEIRDRCTPGVLLR